ncbi:hypothetical protein B0H16DRAFT_1797882 [Mycena metata]|uniref:Uncharacterized protein n=1 Tax=Mycena metata TaxID=1033252 RepID=A0AAD7HDP5_9AGAR|nr:hypothetical protein B0H16DRAFT_1797882 [Mycena metata]
MLPTPLPQHTARELKGKYKELAQSKYSKFLVTKLICLCHNHRPSILMEFQGHVLQLLLHREASSVLADAFELYANTYERTLLVRDFYGKETALFTVTSGTDNDKERARKGLADVLNGADPDRRKRVLASMKEALTKHGRKGGAKCGVDTQTLYKLRSRPGRTGAAEDRPETNELRNAYGKNVEGPTTPFLLRKRMEICGTRVDNWNEAQQRRKRKQVRVRASGGN